MLFRYNQQPKPPCPAGVRVGGVPFRRVVPSLLTVVVASLLRSVCASPVAEALVDSWAVTVEGEQRQRTLRIMRVEELARGEARVMAQYGWRGEKLSPVAVTLTEADGAIRLRFTTQLGSQINVTASGGDGFSGQFRNASGEVKAVSLSRMAAGEDTATAKTVHYLVRPAPSVPADCAAFGGLWEGSWSFFQRGKAWLWVLEVSDDCTAKVAYQSHLTRPTAVRTAEIRHGVLMLHYTGGTDTFSLTGDEMRANGNGFFTPANNSAKFQRITDTLP